MQGINQGIVQGVGAVHQRYPRTAAEMAALTGRTPSQGWSFQNLAAPQAPLFGSDSFSEANSPTWGRKTPYAGKRAVGFTLSGTGNVRAASNAVFQFTTGSFAWLAHIRFGSFQAGLNRDVFGKYNASTGRYVASVNGSGLLTFAIKDTATLKSIQAGSTSVEGLDTWCWFGVDRTADRAYVAHRLDDGSIDISAVGSITNTGIFRWGYWNALNVEFDLLAAYLFEGSDAEGDGLQVIADLGRYVDT